MNSPSSPMVDCRVIGGDKLPADLGGSDVVCAAIARAAAAKAPASRFKVDIEVRGESSMTAVLTTADGRTLPKQTISISDRSLTKGSIDRFANSLVGEILAAASR